MSHQAEKTPMQEFTQLLGVEGAKENALQAFMEAHTEFMPTPVLLNHWLHLNCIVSKLPIGNRVADYAYLTKSSVDWKLVLVELEDSDKKLFTNSSRHDVFSAAMNDAVAQVDVWREYWEDSKKTVINSLEPILVPSTMRRNTMNLECVLIMGRSSEYEHNETRRRRLASLRQDKGIHFMTYDSVINSVESGPRFKKAILTKAGNGFRLKSIEGVPEHIFSYVYPEHLSVDPGVEAALRTDGYDIDSWRANNLLVVNGRWSRESAATGATAGMHPVAVKILKASGQKKTQKKT